MAPSPARWPAFVGAFAAAFDNFAMTPLVRAIGEDLGVPLADATAVASSYYLAYGLMQLPWGLTSERIGRVTAMRVGLLLGVLGAVASVQASSIEGLLAARFVAGAGMAAVVPAVIAWFGEALPALERPRAATDMNVSYALGAGIGVLSAGVLVERFGWAPGFGASGGLMLVALVSTVRLHPPERPARPGSLATALREPSVRALAAVALFEGAVLFGLFAFLAPTMLAAGASATVAGALVAAYGVSVVGWAWLSRRVVPTWSPLQAMGFGGAMLVAAWTLVAAAPGSATVLSAAVLLGATIVFFHSPLQVWATQASPASRGPGVAMFSGSLFIGASLGTRLARPVFAAGEVSLLFGGGAAVSLAVVLIALWARRAALARSAA